MSFQKTKILETLFLEIILMTTSILKNKLLASSLCDQLYFYQQSYRKFIKSVTSTFLKRESVLWVGNKAYSALIKELRGSLGFWNVKKTYTEIAEKLCVDEETVRNRIKHLKEDGLLLGWRLIPNPIVLNRKSSFLLMNSAGLSSKQETISQLESRDGVVQVINYYGDELLITLFDDSQKGLLIKSLRWEKLNLQSFQKLVSPKQTFR